jgi:dTDP-glucose 4,6-dehydratase
MFFPGQGIPIVNYDKLTYAGKPGESRIGCRAIRITRFVRGDICDASAVEAAMRGCDAVVHFAAESHVDRSIYEPAPVIETNVTGTFMLLQIAREAARRAICAHLDRRSVRRHAPGRFCDMRIRRATQQPYSASKASSDLLVYSYVRTYGFPG